MSDKCKLVDQNTFDILQQNNCNPNPSNSSRRVHNAKYKRMTSNGGFSLLMFMKKKESINGDNKKSKRRYQRSIIGKSKTVVNKKGKRRENGSKDSQTRLKKAIIRCRKKKALSRGQQYDIEKTASQLEELTVDTVLAEKNELENEEIWTVESRVNVKVLHTRKFREYCNNCITPELKKQTELLLRELNHFQRRAYARNEIRARAHRRFVVGFRQVENYLRINKVRLVVIATDCEKCEGEAGLDQTILTIKTQCADQNVPIAFTFDRRKLAYILFKRASISCVGILDYNGVRDIFEDLLVALKQSQESYEELVNKEYDSSARTNLEKY